MKQQGYKIYYLYILAACCLLAACTKLRDTYGDFVEGGEIYYPGRADSLKAYPGNNRIRLQWLLIADPKIIKNKIYWNNKADSLEIAVNRSAGIDTIEAMLNPMSEGTYTFEVYTFDKKGNRSVKTDIIANVYGYNYNITLVNRAVKSTKMNATADTAVVDFYKTSIQHIGIDLRYKNQLGDSVNVFVPVTADRFKLPGFVPGESFIYRSLYKPEENAIDTFYSEFESMQVL